MARATMNEWLTYGLSPSFPAILFAVVLVLSIPILHHIYLYRKRSSTVLPSFLLVGPCGAGKTSLLTLLERGTSSATHTSQAPLTIETSLPVNATASSDRFRSANDPTNQIHKKLLVVDTPGHGKLRQFALEHLTNPQHLKGIIYVVDATTLSSNPDDASVSRLGEAAEYLHDVLLMLQKKHTSSKTSKAQEVFILVAANKLDLFTALPARLVGASLEAEITRLRTTRSKGLVDSGVGLDDSLEDDRDILGGGGEGKFTFDLMEEYNIFIEVAGGNVLGSTGSDVSQWWDWIANRL